MRLTLEDAVKRYGPIINGVWKAEAKWCTFAKVPPEVKLVNQATRIQMSRIYCNLDMAPALERALIAVAKAGCAHELGFYCGCFMIREVRGEPTKLSTHAYALAIDFDCGRFPLGSMLRFSPTFVRCFTDQGFSYGGDFRRRDPMHFSFAWE